MNILPTAQWTLTQDPILTADTVPAPVDAPSASPPPHPSQTQQPLLAELMRPPTTASGLSAAARTHRPAAPRGIAQLTPLPARIAPEHVHALLLEATAAQYALQSHLFEHYPHLNTPLRTWFGRNGALMTALNQLRCDLRSDEITADIVVLSHSLHYSVWALSQLMRHAGEPALLPLLQQAAESIKVAARTRDQVRRFALPTTRAFQLSETDRLVACVHAARSPRTLRTALNGLQDWLLRLDHELERIPAPRRDDPHASASGGTRSTLERLRASLLAKSESGSGPGSGSRSRPGSGSRPEPGSGPGWRWASSSMPKLPPVPTFPRAPSPAEFSTTFPASEPSTLPAPWATEALHPGLKRQAAPEPSQEDWQPEPTDPLTGTPQAPLGDLAWDDSQTEGVRYTEMLGSLGLPEDFQGPVFQ